MLVIRDYDDYFRSCKHKWFTENDIFQTSKEALKEIFELAEEQQVVEKAGGVIDSLKEKVTN